MIPGHLCIISVATRITLYGRGDREDPKAETIKSLWKSGRTRSQAFLFCSSVNTQQENTLDVLCQSMAGFLFGKVDDGVCHLAVGLHVILSN